MRILIILTQIFLICNADSELEQQTVSPTVFDQSLVKKTPHASEILNNFDKYNLDVESRVENKVIGFVSQTEESYEDATTFTKKFTYISPLWFNIKRTGDREYTVSGVENFDRQWIENMMETRRDIKIVPRVTFKGWTAKDFLMLATSDFEWISLGNELVHFSQSFYFHGLVLDMWSEFSGKIPNQILIPLTQELCVRLRMNYFEAILIISPNVGYFNRHFFEELAEFASGFSLEPFEFPARCSNPTTGVPTGVIEEFIKDISTEERHRHIILLGLNLYGWSCTKTTRRIIRKDEYLDLLEKYDDYLKYDDVSEENYFDIKINNEGHRITFPTLYTINERIELANKLGIGISIWELSDGLEYIYELL